MKQKLPREAHGGAGCSPAGHRHKTELFSMEEPIVQYWMRFEGGCSPWRKEHKVGQEGYGRCWPWELVLEQSASEGWTHGTDPCWRSC